VLGDTGNLEKESVVSFKLNNTRDVELIRERLDKSIRMNDSVASRRVK
jgi:hypothetical protein